MLEMIAGETPLKCFRSAKVIRYSLEHLVENVRL